MATLASINRRIRELRAAGEKSNAAYERLRPDIRRLERQKEELEKLEDRRK